MVAEEAAPEGLLERVDDARRVGATILAMDGDDRELRGLAHESLTVPAERLAGLLRRRPAPRERRGRRADAPRRGLRDRLADLLDTITGPPAG